MVTLMSVLTHLHSRINAKLPQVPATLIRFTSTPVMELFLNTGINHLLKKERQQNELDFLKGQVARVEITDLKFDFSFTLINQKLVVTVPGRPGDATLKSDQESMLKILHGEVDPDTLFFRRKLLITGDTELGLYIKNMIDTIDLTQRIPKPIMHLLTHIHKASRQPQTAEKRL